MKKPVRITVLVLCLTAILFVLSSCGSAGVKASDQSESPLVGTWIAQKKGDSDYTFNADGTEERYIRTVRSSDLDVNRHMNNLHYIAMFQDACDSRFWRDFVPKEMEICFMSQCREGEEISVRSQMTGNTVHFAALHQDGRIASVADFRR